MGDRAGAGEGWRDARAPLEAVAPPEDARTADGDEGEEGRPSPSCKNEDAEEEEEEEEGDPTWCPFSARKEGRSFWRDPKKASSFCRTVSLGFFAVALPAVVEWWSCCWCSWSSSADVEDDETEGGGPSCW